MKKEIVFLLKYNEISASTRQRFLCYFPYIDKKINIKTNILFDKNYFVTKILNNRFPLLKILSSYFKRIIFILSLAKNSKIIIQSELLPYAPIFLEKFLVYKKIKYIIDLDDAFFHRYDQSSNFLIKFFLKKKYNYIFQKASCVILGSHYLRQQALLKGAKKTKIIPAGIVFSDYKKFFFTKKEKIFTIVWIGSPTTSHYLKKIFPVLEEFSKNYKFVLRLVGAHNIDTSYLPIETYKWSKDSEVSLLSESHLGIMPLENSYWEKGKCAFKLIQYMAAGLPVIGSPVGENRRVIKHGVNGFLANTNEQWFDYLELMYKNKKLRNKFGNNGKNFIKNNYSIEYLQKEFQKTLNIL